MLNILDSVRLNQKNIEKVISGFIFNNVFNPNVRKAGHFKTWFQIPMSYARIMEIPLTMLLLDAKKEDRILDVSSPKLLALYYGLSGYSNVVAADMEDYFVNDFEIFKRYSGLDIETKVFDTTKIIPYPENYFDKIFSVSVLEHIPYDGDTEALKQMLRVLKPGGIAVITLPAFSNYIEEWISSKSFYWKSVTNANGAVFYQRRYDLESIHSRLVVNGGKIDEILFVAEKPIKEAGLNHEGRMLHNSYYTDNFIISKYLKKLKRFQIPLSEYFAENYVSQKCHYITNDHSDVNIRQVAIKIKKDS